MAYDFNLPEPQKARYDILVIRNGLDYISESCGDKLDDISDDMMKNLLERIVDKHNPREVRIQIDIK